MSMKENFKPVFYTSLTTVIGFLSLNASNSPPFRDLGNFVSLGVAIAFFYAVTLLPILLLLFPIKAKRDLPHINWLSWTTGVQKTAKPVLLVTVGIMLLATWGLSQNQFNDDWVAYFDESVPFRQAVDYSEKHLSGTTTMEYVLESNTSISDPEFLAHADAFKTWLESLPQTRHVFSFTDVYKRLNKNMHDDDPAYYRLPDNQELAAQYLLLYEMSLPYGLDINNQITLDKKALRMMLTFENLSSTQILELEQQIAHWLNEHADVMHFYASSPSSIFAHLSQTNIRSMLLGTGAAMLLISFILAFALKSWKLGVLSIIPNVLPAFVAFGLWGISVGEINLGLSIVASMTLGIVVDDTVHFLTHYQYAREKCGCSQFDGIHRTLEQAGHAIVITTAILLLGFLVLATSDFNVNSNLGLLTAFTLFIALIGDLIVLPTLLMFAQQKEAKKSNCAKETLPAATGERNV